MRLFLFFFTFLSISSGLFGRNSESSLIDNGSYYGVNYTVPFAHAYRALDFLGVDHRKAIERDVYHIARMGLNAFRLHLWDVELTDADGNLLEKDNKHLELLDYLISQLKKRGVKIVLTAQTNFGNGYPERNTDPNGAFSYKFDKCDVHDNPVAVQAQENYLKALVNHVNPYTNKSYAEDPDILALEINNEPCHSGDALQITAYINRMASTLREAGWEKDILYNVSHNLDRVEGFYNADIDGTTFQWYPTGLVHGATRQGNFLPMLDSYDIPWDTIPGFSSRSRVIYEYDPADVLDTYLYPAAVRTFRKAGFSWVTQFAYDPIDMAVHNTEYQTHFLNLAFTPGKAVGMMIAAEAMRQLPIGANYGKYPADTVFGNESQFLVSAKRNLSVLNDGVRYYHTNNTDISPKSPESLRAIAGVGSSPVVATDGTGAYFLDKLDDGLWRLEVMPDVIITDDPFAKPSFNRDVAHIIDRKINLSVNDSILFKDKKTISVSSVDGSRTIEKNVDGSMTLYPGIYILSSNPDYYGHDFSSHAFGLTENMRAGEYVAPESSQKPSTIVHNAPAGAVAGKPVRLTALWAGYSEPDSIVVYPLNVNFWREKNKLYPMSKTSKYEYSAEIPVRQNEHVFGYRIVAWTDGKTTTYPARLEGTPLDWDFPETEAYTIPVIDNGMPIELLRPSPDMDGSELTTIPEGWRGVSYTYSAPIADVPRFKLELNESSDSKAAVVSKFIAPKIKALTENDNNYSFIRIYLGITELTNDNSIMKIGLVNDNGFTYTAPVNPGKEIIDIPLSEFVLDSTILSPAPFPAFLGRSFTPDSATATPLAVESLQSITFEIPKGSSVEIKGIELR